MSSGGAGARALVRAFKQVFDIDNPLEGVRLGGHTDPQIILDTLAKRGLTERASPTDPDRIRDLYLEYLADEIHKGEKACVLPGVVTLLEELAAHPEVKLALVTGNFERGARIKLGRFDLNRFFDLGGFGSDSIHRRDLVPIAMDRARARFGTPFHPADTIVLGDTEKDIDCGRHSGCKTVAVSTGSIAADVLKAETPDLFFENFSDTGRVVDQILAL